MAEPYVALKERSVVHEEGLELAYALRGYSGQAPTIPACPPKQGSMQCVGGLRSIRL